ncbi:hypothetical protein L1987_54120 [Smallanthus sonchifolius]|uniref:Uncharacterized protein n=1 Tax=Smallanthus sonchifolius TaxID=185202 RepID=A0ACB9E6Y7_9ASTR|nr:hypothetical protein L1987_54120 [Smallanthus sonchifolius]
MKGLTHFSSSFYTNSSFHTVAAFHNIHHQIKDSTDKADELPSIMKESVSRKDTGLETQQDEVHISAIHMTCMFK